LAGFEATRPTPTPLRYGLSPIPGLALDPPEISAAAKEARDCISLGHAQLIHYGANTPQKQEPTALLRLMSGSQVATTTALGGASRWQGR
jgi:hypothetical protein